MTLRHPAEFSWQRVDVSAELRDVLIAADGARCPAKRVAGVGDLLQPHNVRTAKDAPGIETLSVPNHRKLLALFIYLRRDLKTPPASAQEE